MANDFRHLLAIVQVGVVAEQVFDYSADRLYDNMNKGVRVCTCVCVCVCVCVCGSLGAECMGGPLRFVSAFMWWPSTAHLAWALN